MMELLIPSRHFQIILKILDKPYLSFMCPPFSFHRLIQRDGTVVICWNTCDINPILPLHRSPIPFKSDGASVNEIGTAIEVRDQLREN